MTTVTYIEHDGAEHTVKLSEGTTIMQGAVDNMIDGIVGECGGGLACATCHCYVDDSWLETTGTASETELQMMEFSGADTKPNSRLSCQITASASLDGLVVRLPESQY